MKKIFCIVLLSLIIVFYILFIIKYNCLSNNKAIVENSNNSKQTSTVFITKEEDSIVDEGNDKNSNYSSDEVNTVNSKDESSKIVEESKKLEDSKAQTGNSKITEESKELAVSKDEIENSKISEQSKESEIPRYESVNSKIIEESEISEVSEKESSIIEESILQESIDDVSDVSKEVSYPSSNVEDSYYEVQENSMPKSKKLNVKNIQQLPEYEAGCEITSTTILLNYYGYDIEKTELVKYLPTKPYYYKDGVMYCGDPNVEFCGDVKSAAYGCYSGAIVKTINNYFNSIGERSHYTIEYKNVDPKQLYYQVSKGRPVIVWATIFMRESYKGESWVIEGTNDTFQWITREHCLVLIGYTEDEVILSDPYDSRGTVMYSKELFERRFKELGSQAIVLM